MDPQPRRQLATLLEKEGVGLADDPQRIKAHLLDTCPESRIETELLVAGAADGLAARLARSSDTVFRDGEIARAVAEIKRNRRLDQEAAEWVVRSWAWALGVVDQEPSDVETDVHGSTPSAGAAYTAPSSAPPQYQPPGPRSVPAYEQSTPSSAPQFQSTGSASSPQYGQAASAPPWGSGPSTPPYGQTGGQWNSTPSAPPWGSGSSAPPQSHPSAPPFGSDPPYEATRPAWAAGPASQSAPQAQWPTPPYSGAHASGMGGGPPMGPAGPQQSPPSGKRRGWIVGLVAALLAVVGVVVAVVLVNSRPDPTPEPDPTPTPPTASSTSPPTSPPTSTEPATVDFGISSSYTFVEDLVRIDTVVWSQGREVGTLVVDPITTYAWIPVYGPPGANDYELEVTFWFEDGTPVTFGGSGSLEAYEGAEYTVDFTPRGADWEATLRAVE